ncbi:MAG: hypothetical protein AAF065_07675 [Verrucomicrobiota bacterium]
MSIPYYFKNFGAFVSVGVLFYFFAVGLNWVALDLMEMHAFITPLCIISFLFVLKYFVYLWAQTIVPSFWRYTFSNITLTLIATLAISFAVDSGIASGWLSTAVILAFFMVVRYIVLHRWKVIRRPDTTS